jgi:hypothetical protein
MIVRFSLITALAATAIALTPKLAVPFVVGTHRAYR